VLGAFYSRVVTVRDSSATEALVRENAALREAQGAISTVLLRVARSDGLHSVLEEVVEAATRLTESKNGRLWLFREGMLHVAANCGAREGLEYDREHPEVPGRSSIAGRAALTRDIVHLPDVNADPEYTYAGPRYYGSALSVPIMLEDELIGVIGIVRGVIGPFDDAQIELVKMFAAQAATAIANARLLDTVERQRQELSRFLSPQIADVITSERGAQLLAGHRAYISVLFCDLRGFTAFAETAAPEELFDLLREYHVLMGELIGEHGGTVEHFAGDGLMVFFNDPVPLERHELQAVRLALHARQRFSDMAAAWRKRGINLGIGIGIAAGYATLGRIGFEGRYDYGALGPVTNLASRLSSEVATGEILVSAPVFAAVEDEVDVESAGEIELKGFSRPASVHRVRALRNREQAQPDFSDLQGDSS
jgi:class 3 adenylate cyclase/putative methionine-R-sulfoxide reductase with GAF domain